MRTVLITISGIVLLATFLGAGKAFFRERMSVIFAVPCALWVSVAAINMWIGVVQAGYSVAEELPIFVAITAVPIVVGYLVQKVLRRTWQFVAAPTALAEVLGFQ